MGDTSNRKDHSDHLKELDISDKQPTMGKKGGELPTRGHGPAVNKNQENRQGGGQDKDKKKSD